MKLVESITESISRSDIANQWSRAQSGTPTQHAVIDRLLPDDLAFQVAAAFPTNGKHFTKRRSFRESKSVSVAFDQLPAILKEVTFAIQSPEVIAAIGQRLDMAELTGDPSLYAGGLSMMNKGDFLNPHIDNSHEASRTRYRRVNLLYYATPDWREEFGGNLELWDATVTKPVTLAALFNRLVIMQTNRHSWHSVSPVEVDGARACLSNYFFSAQSPESRDYYHVTSFTGRPGQRLRRGIGLLDNAARNLARQLGARRATDNGYQTAAHG